MTPRSLRNNDAIAGFTLLETLIATALTATILVVLATITSRWLPNWNRGLARVQQNEQLALGLERVVADLAAAEFILTGRESRQVLFDGTEHAVTFVRTALNPNSRSSLEVVRIAETPSQNGLLLVRTTAPFVPVTAGINDRDQPNFNYPVVLLRAPFRLSLSYAGPDRIWQPTWRWETKLPRALELTLRDVPTQRTLAVSTVAVVHAELPAECISAKSPVACLSSKTATTASREDDNRNHNGGSLR